jgi:ComF family protein
MLEFPAPPLCRVCRLPLHNKRKTLCEACRFFPPAFDDLFVPLLYNDIIRHLIVELKYSRHFAVIPLLGHFLLHKVPPEILREADMFLAVPLHWRRLVSRGYNQSFLLARYLARESGKALHGDILRRKRSTKVQRNLNPNERMHNLHGAFCVDKPESIKGKTLLLVDDIFTTGATSNECCRILKEAGAKKVFVLALARVDLPRPLVIMKKERK